jgi:hypothetical protein
VRVFGRSMRASRRRPYPCPGAGTDSQGRMDHRVQTSWRRTVDKALTGPRCGRSGQISPGRE